MSNDDELVNLALSIPPYPTWNGNCRPLGAPGRNTAERADLITFSRLGTFWETEFGLLQGIIHPFKGRRHSWVRRAFSSL